MPNYHRNYVPGGTYFFTVVTQPGNAEVSRTTGLIQAGDRDAAELCRGHIFERTEQPTHRGASSGDDD